MTVYLSIDIGGTYIKYGEVTSTGTILNHAKVVTPKQNLTTFFWQQFIKLSVNIKVMLPGSQSVSPGKLMKEPFRLAVRWTFWMALT
ncbi:hypothetical protein [Lentilactobacillus kisonensis]|uniref:hypothetical protein n=1 Tax=Lentilactobacillus kisonensis TaxID=481722 RepID=UPI000B047629|nr:hypothetical protein [Lentilactobacillus kisonensis]